MASICRQLSFAKSRLTPRVAKWRPLSTTAVVSGGQYKAVTQLESMEWKDVTDRAMTGILMTEMARGMAVSFGRNCNVRRFHRSAIVLDEIREVVVPALAESLSEGDIKWDKAVGDSVAQDEVVGEVETDKTLLGGGLFARPFNELYD